MNLIDFMNSVKPNTENSFSNKIAKRTEEKELERFSERVIEDVLRMINGKFEYIGRGLSYGPEAKISDEDIKDLTEKLKNQIKEIPNKLKSEIESIFGTSSDEDKKEDEEKKSVETEQPQQQQPQQQTMVQQPSASIETSFGY